MNNLDDEFEEEAAGFAEEPDVETHAHTREHARDRQRLALQMLRQSRDSLTHIIHLFENGDTTQATREMVDFVSQKKKIESELERKTGARVIEGVFDGQGMISADGVRHAVPENYASKSKLVEGDILKLIIKPDGTHIFKQISPIKRQRRVGKLGVDPSTQEPVVVCGEDVYKVLAASISYFKCVLGDGIVVLIPADGTSVWAAVERITH